MSAFAFQKMVYQALVASPAVCAGRVYDHVPDRAVYPYVSLTEAEALDVAGTGGAANDQEVVLNISVWSMADGFKEAAEIADAIRARLHRTVLDGQSTGWRAVFNYERDRGLLRDPDGSRRVLCRYRAYLEAVT